MSDLDRPIIPGEDRLQDVWPDEAEQAWTPAPNQLIKLHARLMVDYDCGCRECLDYSWAITEKWTPPFTEPEPTHECLRCGMPVDPSDIYAIPVRGAA